MPLGDVFLDRAIQPLRLEEDHGVLARERGQQQALGVGGGRGNHDLEPGRVAEIRLGTL